ncbi:MAG: ribulose-phosphate 3-epimerase [Vicinamibacterales bacterium]|nr:ribulose-phosphate 3-epimerase [Vicinamibacterales bacterium]
MSVLIAPSILSADFAALGQAVRATERGGADAIHIDVMDGHFVPNLTVGPPVVQAIKRIAEVPLDVHLMIEEPDNYLSAFAQAGADALSVHVEVLSKLQPTINAIKELGVRAGIALNPSTPVTAIEVVAREVDLVLVMSVNPGFGGQTFIPQSLNKVRATRALLDQVGNPAPITVDGGVNLGNAAALVEAGASVLVAGSAIFGQDDPTEATRALRNASQASSARESA